jgi:hypothetical protein
MIDEEMQNNIYYLLQGLLEVGCSNLEKMIRVKEKTQTLIEDKNGEISIYGIAHKKGVA